MSSIPPSWRTRFLTSRSECATCACCGLRSPDPVIILGLVYHRLHAPHLTTTKKSLTLEYGPRPPLP